MGDGKQMSYDDNDSDLVKDLRNQIENLGKENKGLKKANEELTTYKVKVTVDDVIEKRGLNPKIKALIPKDVEDVSAWLEEFGELFGAAPSTDTAGDDAGAVEEEVAELDKQNNSESTGAGDTGLSAKIDATENLDELVALINANAT